MRNYLTNEKGGAIVQVMVLGAVVIGMSYMYMSKQRSKARLDQRRLGAVSMQKFHDIFEQTMMQKETCSLFLESAFKNRSFSHSTSRVRGYANVKRLGGQNRLVEVGQEYKNFKVLSLKVKNRSLALYNPSDPLSLLNRSGKATLYISYGSCGVQQGANCPASKMKIQSYRFDIPYYAYLNSSNIAKKFVCRPPINHSVKSIADLVADGFCGVLGASQNAGSSSCKSATTTPSNCGSKGAYLKVSSSGKLSLRCKEDDGYAY